MAAAIQAGKSIDELYRLTKIDKWFLYKFKNIVDHNTKLEEFAGRGQEISHDLMLRVKQLGFSDEQIARAIKRYGHMSLFSNMTNKTIYFSIMKY